MHLIIGGAAQGKLDYALHEAICSPALVLDGAKSSLDPFIGRVKILNRLHILVRRLMQAGKEPLSFVLNILEQNPGIVIVCDEIGCGVVPCDAFERSWREQTGRLLCVLAQRARRVDRVHCGIAQTIKGGRNEAHSDPPCENSGQSPWSVLGIDR